MANELYFPFNAVEDEAGNLDRVYDAEDFSMYFAQFISDGVYPVPSTGLSVMAMNHNMLVTVKAGSGFIHGRMYLLMDDMRMSVNPSHPSYNRKDNIVLQLNRTDRFIKCLYKPGTATSNPLPPTLLRNDDVYELKLAEILVRSGTQSITQADILDTRLDNEVCGIVHAVVDSVDTTKLFQQYETYLHQKMSEWNNTKKRQEQEFQNQLAQQDTEFYNTFDAKRSEIDEWYAGIKANIAKLQTFDFDNLSSFQGCTCDKQRVENGYLHIIKISATGRKVAERHRYRIENGYVEHLKVYEEDGKTLMKERTITKTRVENGYSEVVT